jgi:enamine deaminase RidA (YjgF/YER057c/UK114 family)
MAVRGLGGLWVWVSGTASIVGEKVAHPGDVRAQAEETFDNIAALLDGENFARHGWPGVSAGLMDMVCARVYVKDAGMGEICRAVCERRLPPCPTVYVQADICRPELLVEVEGLVFRRLSGPEGT